MVAWLWSSSARSITHVVIQGNFDGPGLGIELDDNLIENERHAPEWEFPVRSDSFDGAVLDH